MILIHWDLTYCWYNNKFKTLLYLYYLTDSEPVAVVSFKDMQAKPVNWT